MMKNRALWVALAVIAIAALLMFFVVLPQMKDNKAVQQLTEKAGETVEGVKATVKDTVGQAADAVNDAAKQVKDVAADTAGGAKAETLAKMARLKADVETSVSEFQRLFDAGKVPTADELAAARAKLETALKAAADFKAPEGADPVTGALAKSVAEGAGKALSTVSAIPADAEGAAKAVEAMKNSLMGLFAPTTDAAKPAPTDAEQTKTEANLPAFDVLRVEPDGSTVIAGRAAPGAKLEIVDGDKVISSANADAGGDFAAILENPLTPGDHQIVLRATASDGKTQDSVEVATISVPADAKGELLAMITKPGEASRIIAMPETKPAEQVVAEASKSVTPAATGTQANTEEKPAETKATETAQSATAPSAIPELPKQAADLASTPPTVPAQTQAADTAAVQPAAAPEIAVTAVEIEGDKIFIAGNARPGSVVRVYADDALVAEVKGDEKGRFVADNTLKLSVGDHTIRADLLGADGKKVEFRASVPFFRPEGEQLAAVAADHAPEGPPLQPLADGAFDKAREEARKAVALLTGLYADGKTPSVEELAAARSSTEIALKTLTELKLAAGVDPAVAEMATKVSAAAAEALARLKALPKDSAAIKAALSEIEKGVGMAISPVMQDKSTPVAGTEAKPSAPTTEQANTADAAKPAAAMTQADAGKAVSPPDAATAAKTQQAATDAASSSSGESATAEGPKVIEQAPLKPTEGSVIIRRGDTLWQISRRVYGKGVRYTTIYLANKGQISDPDRIMPGQVFGVPDKPLGNAEELHRKRLGLE